VLLLGAVGAVLALLSSNVRLESGASCTAQSAEDAYEADGIAQDIKRACPLSTPAGRFVGQRLLHGVASVAPKLGFLNLWPAGVSAENWSDTFTRAGYLLVARVSLGLYKARDAAWARVPESRLAADEVLRVENVLAPHTDPDGTPNFYWFESMVPGFLMDRLYVPLVTCFYSSLRRLSTDSGELNGTFDDTLEDPVANQWSTVLAASSHENPHDWVMSFYSNASTWDGNPIWPRQMTNFQVYFKQDQWDDALENAFAFHLIGTHRLEHGNWAFDSVPGLGKMNLPFRLPLNSFAGLPVRAGFGKYGCDLYFNQDGMPVLVETPEGELVQRGDKQWQYWKFVWRSTLVTGITLVDHLHLAHFRAANLLSRAVRVSLPPTNPIRRVASIFTFGSIFVNLQAMHTLIGPNHMLQRATPFSSFTKLANIVPSGDSGLLADITEIPAMRALLSDAEFAKLPPMLQASPFYSDSRLLVGALRKLTRRVMEVSQKHICDAGSDWHRDWSALRLQVMKDTMAAQYAVSEEMMDVGRLRNMSACDLPEARRALEQRLVAYLFLATGWHRHVGFVGDYYGNPSLATMSWKDGEAMGRPRQHMIMTYINVFTSTKQPLLKEDYTHLFKGMVPDMEGEFSEMWQTFRQDLEEIEVEVDRRNEKREIVNYNGSPKVIECAVSK